MLHYTDFCPFRAGCKILLLRFQLKPPVNLEEKCHKYDEDANNGDWGEDVVEDDTGDDHGCDLPRRHYEDKDDRSEGADGVENEELSNCRGIIVSGRDRKG